MLPFLVWPYFPPELQIHVPKWFALFIIGNLLFACFLSRKLHYLFSLFHGVIVVGVLVSGFGSWQIYPLIQWTAGVFMAMWFVEQPPGMRLMIYKILVVGALIMSAHAFLQTQGLDPIFQYAPGVPNNHPIGMMGQATKFGVYAAVCASIALAIGWYIAFIPLAIMCVWTTSSFSIAALGAGILVWLKYQDIKLFKFTLKAGILAVIALYFIPGTSFLFYGQGRLEIWHATIKAWVTGAPFLGHGPGSFFYTFSSTYQPISTLQHGEFGAAHNDYLQALYEYGSMGLVCIILALCCIFHSYRVKWWKKRFQDKDMMAAQGTVAAILVNMIGNFPTQLATTFTIGILSLALLLKKDESATIRL